MPEVLMPRLSDTMEEGTLSRWLKREGDQVRKGEVIAEIETGKAIMELEAYDQGILTRILLAEGASAPIGMPIAVIGGEPAVPTPQAPAREEQPEARQPGQPAPVPPALAPVSEAPPAPPAAALAAEPGRAPTSPLARRHGIDLAAIEGSGPGGRVGRADVEDAIARAGGQPRPGSRPRGRPPARTPRRCRCQPCGGSPPRAWPRARGRPRISTRPQSPTPDRRWSSRPA
jgi:pyruvate dehydrogenase E2 component (dihydrolipoamide acetyltransferase)